MYEELLTRVDFIPIPEGELDEVFSVDTEGRAITLREYIDQHAGEDKCILSALSSSCTPIGPDANSTGKQSRITEEEIARLVEQYLASVPDDVVMSIIGSGTFTVDELRDEFHKRTAVGERLAEMVLDGHMFVDEAIKLGKIRIESEKEVSSKK